MRNKKIDVMRGIAILLVVLGHSIGDVGNSMNKIILSFHMPLFFIISGMVAKYYYHNKNNPKEILKVIIKKIKSILIPNFIMGVILLLYEIAELFVLKKELNVAKCFFGYWFLWTLFFVSMLFIICSTLLDINNKKVKITISIISLLIALYFAFKIKEERLIGWNIIPMGFLFYWLGFIFKDRILSQRLIKIVEEKIIFIVPILVIISLINVPVLMYKNEYGNIILFFATAFLGLTIVLWSSNKLEENNLLNFIGRNSIIFYIMHWIFFLSFKGMLIRTNVIQSDNVLYWITFLISLIGLLIISKIYLYIDYKLKKYIYK